MLKTFKDIVTIYAAYYGFVAGTQNFKLTSNKYYNTYLYLSICIEILSSILLAHFYIRSFITLVSFTTIIDILATKIEHIFWIKMDEIKKRRLNLP